MKARVDCDDLIERKVLRKVNRKERRKEVKQD